MSAANLEIFAAAIPNLPAPLWWLVPFALAVLGTAALVDARTGRVPDSSIFFGLLVSTAAQGFAGGWNLAARNLALAVAVGVFFWAVNQLWFRIKKRDALGMGDAKWSMLAVNVFGLMPLVAAWVAGAWLALIYMAVKCAAKRKAGHVYFAPFLFFGLLAWLYWFRT